MKVTICAATSVDGFIATKDGNSDWVLDDAIFEKSVQDFGCIVLGNTTFEQYRDDMYPIKGVEHIVLSASEQKSDYPNVTYAGSPQEAIKLAEQKGFDGLLCTGGSKTNESFIRAGLVDTIVIDLHPLILGEGKKIFGDFSDKLELEQVESSPQPEGFTHVVYKVKGRGNL